MTSSAKDYLEGYLEILKRRRPRTKAMTRIGELFEENARYVSWDNETLERDTKAVFVALNAAGYDHAQRILVWARGKDLHPKQLIKALYGKRNEGHVSD